ncbi:MAG: BON domain-containing protein [Lysobacter sp.]
MRSNDVGSDLKAVAQDVLQMGARCVQAGRAWLTDRRNEMTDRNDEYRPGNPAANPTPRDGRAQGQGAQQSHMAEERGARDYGRGQQGMEREYGTRFERGYEETRRGEAASRGQTYSWDDGDRSGRRGQGGWGQDRSDQFQYGLPRQDRAGAQRQEAHAGYRNPEAGSSQGSHEYGSYGGREAGEGYGRSSGYGSPEQDRYAGSDSYRGTSFVSPADTQLGHSGLGRQNYSGMGPKNYKRSDERINEDLCERLTRDHDIDASELEVRIADGAATLEGSVPQRWMKHRAEDLADGCAGVRNVENRIKVQSAGSYDGPSTQRDISGGTDTPASQNQNQNQSRRPGGTAH